MKYCMITAIFLLAAIQLLAQRNLAEQQLKQMTDSVNYLIKNSQDGFVQPIFSINTKGDISILDSKKAGFRFNLFSLHRRDSTEGPEKGIAFIPENSKSITTNKFILFKDKSGKTVGLFKFTRTGDEYVRSIYEILLRIRSHLFKHYKPE